MEACAAAVTLTVSKEARRQASRATFFIGCIEPQRRLRRPGMSLDGLAFLLAPGRRGCLLRRLPDLDPLALAIGVCLLIISAPVLDRW